MTIKFETQNIRDIGVFERLTKVHVKDVIRDENCVYFMIEPGKSGLAIGRNGYVAKNVGRVLGKPVKVFEFSDDLETMVKSMIPSARNFEKDGETVAVTIPQADRSLVIGRNGRNIRIMKEFLNRHFKIKYLRLR